MLFRGLYCFSRWLRSMGRHVDPRRSLKARLGLAMGCIALTVTLIVGAFIDSVASTHLKTDIGNSFAQIAFHIAGELDQNMFERYREVQNLALLDEIRNPNHSPEQKRALLEQVQSTYAYYSWIGLTDPQGRVLASTGGQLTGVDVSQKNWFQQGKTQPYIGDVYEAVRLAKLLPNSSANSSSDSLVSPAEPLRFVDIATPVITPQGKVLGVLAVHLNWEWAEATQHSIYQTQQKYSQVEILIVSSTGRVLLGSPRWQNQVLDLHSIEAAKTSQNSFHIERWADGFPYLIGFAQTHGYQTYPGLGWIVLAQQRADTAFATVEQLGYTILVLNLIAALLLTAVGWLIAGHITRPLLTIATEADQIRWGVSTVRLPLLEGQDELARLSHSLNYLVQTLVARDTALQDAKQLLEQQVASRTRELAETNDRLQRELFIQQYIQRTLQEQAQLLDLAHDMILTRSIDGAITFWNRGAVRMYGWATEEALGKSVHMLLHTQFPQPLADIEAKLFQQGYWEGELIHQKRDGTTIIVASRWVLRCDQTGRPMQILEINNDITQRKQTEQALRESEQFLRDIINAAAEAIWVVERLDDDEFWVVNMNPAIEIATNIFNNQWVGKRLNELWDSETAAQIRLHYEECIQKNATISYEEKLPFDGQSRWFLTTLTPLINTPSQIRLLGASMDITDRKLAEQELQRAKEDAELANQAKSTFLANMSHELRTPLNVILGFTQVMSRDLSLPLEHRKTLQIIHRSGDHLLNLISDVLDLSKIEAGCLTLDLVDFDLMTLLHSLIEMFYQRAISKKIQLSLNINSDVPKYINADTKKIRQILMNLLSNAIKFTEQGNVTLHVSCVTETDSVVTNQAETITPIKLEKTSHNRLPNSNKMILRFAVEDTGVGIASADLDAIFNAFTQATAGRIATEGTGLGLSISHTFAKMMDGELTVHSTLGQGSTFQVILPVHLAYGDDSAIYDTQTVIGLAPGQPTYRILITDDRSENRQLLTQLLKPLGLETREAANGEETIALWQQWQPHLIFMDIQMPDINGYDVTRQIRSYEQAQKLSNPAAHITKIIALTAQASKSDRTLALDAGCDDYLMKPFREAALFSAISAQLGLCYAYAEPLKPNQRLDPSYLASTIDPQFLSRMPSAWVAELADAAVLCDDHGVHQLVEQIPEQELALAMGLTHLVNEFQFTQIIRLIQAFLQK